MVMLSNEVAEIQSATPRQVFALRRLLEEREVPEHFAEVLSGRMNSGELSKKEALFARKKIETFPNKKEKD